MNDSQGNWRDDLTEKEQSELRLAEYYTIFLHHGTPGHSRLMLIHKLATLIDQKASPDMKAQE